VLQESGVDSYATLYTLCMVVLRRVCCNCDWEACILGG